MISERENKSNILCAGEITSSTSKLSAFVHTGMWLDWKCSFRILFFYVVVFFLTIFVWVQVGGLERKKQQWESQG